MKGEQPGKERKVRQEKNAFRTNTANNYLNLKLRIFF